MAIRGFIKKADLGIFLQIVRQYHRFGLADRSLNGQNATLRQVYAKLFHISGYKLVQNGKEFEAHKNGQTVASSATGKQMFREFWHENDY